MIAEAIPKGKKRGSGGDLDTDYRYDGQMLVEESFSGTSYPRDYVQVIRYGLGARGIDFIERVRQQSGTVQGYPIYDGHGNMVATLSKNGNGFLVSDRRAYDAWGNVRKGNTMGEPNGRYCANLGHVQDDESGLVYMRARYYEPWTGRFVSEDPAHHGTNWFAYCSSDPVNKADQTGTIEFQLGDYSFRLDFDLDQVFGDLHVFKNGKELISMFGNGFAHHAAAPNVFTKDMIRTLLRAAMSGHKNAMALANLLMEGHFGFDPDSLRESMSGAKKGGMAILAYTTIDAAFQVDPVFVFGLFKDIFQG